MVRHGFIFCLVAMNSEHGKMLTKSFAPIDFTETGKFRGFALIFVSDT